MTLPSAPSAGAAAAGALPEAVLVLPPQPASIPAHRQIASKAAITCFLMGFPPIR